LNPQCGPASLKTTIATRLLGIQLGAKMFQGKKADKGETAQAAAEIAGGATSQTPRPLPKPLSIFISYRRSSALITDHVHEKISYRLTGTPIFLDRADIEPGAAFPDRLRAAASEASIVLVIIGRDWISAQDERTYRRRLDIPNDWVRREIELALSSGAVVIPVLVENAPMPSAEQLPDSIVELAQKNAFVLSRDHFNDDVNRLCDFLLSKIPAAPADIGAEKFPAPAEIRPVALTSDQLKQVVRNLPQWRVSETSLHDDPRFGPGYTRIELVREFRFQSFLDAIRFMRDASDLIDVHGHHPRWENVFRTVTVWLSTWDIGHRPSDRDLKAAQMLEEAYKPYAELT
jgi:pterin-4a-carbinolamine dehydratase